MFEGNAAFMASRGSEGVVAHKMAYSDMHHLTIMFMARS